MYLWSVFSQELIVVNILEIMQVSSFHMIRIDDTICPLFFINS